VAAYPTSVKTFTTKSDGAGNKIFAAHINDLQDEVTAIEDGLLNGTAPISSSNAAVRNLSVSANSSVTGELFVSVSPPYARVAVGGITAVAHNTRAFLSFATQRSISTASMHSTSANSSRVKVVSSGLYLITGHVEWAAFSSAGGRQVELWLNDTTVLAIHKTPALPAAAALPMSVTTVYYATSTSDYFGLAVFQDSGSTGSLTGTGQYGSDFTVTKIR
jgi:hypothetical protein